MSKLGRYNIDLPCFCMALVFFSLSGCVGKSNDSETEDDNPVEIFSCTIFPQTTILVSPEIDLPLAPASLTQETSGVIFDSLGYEHIAQFHFEKLSGVASGAGETEWALTVTVDDEDVGDPLPLVTGYVPTVWKVRLLFENSMPKGTTRFLVSYWTPLDEHDRPNGTLGPLTILNGGTLDIMRPTSSSNFVVDTQGIQLANVLEIDLINWFQDGRATAVRDECI